MKYRDLRLSFEINNVKFDILSISSETILAPFPRHSHSINSYELHYIKSGFGKLISDAREYDLSPGIFYVTGPNIPHEQVSDSNNPMVEYGMYLQTQQLLPKKPSDLMGRFTGCHFWIGESDKEVSRLFEHIFEELNNKPLGYQLMLPALCESLLLTITRMYEGQTTENAQNEAYSPEDMIYLTIEEAFLYDYRDLSLESLSKRVNLGPRQTERLLKKKYGTTFAFKKAEARMSAASLLLTQTQKSIGEISEELGYSSAEHFTNAFKKFYNITPASFRKQSLYGLSKEKL